MPPRIAVEAFEVDSGSTARAHTRKTYAPSDVSLGGLAKSALRRCPWAQMASFS